MKNSSGVKFRNSKHPECKPGEMWLMNIKCNNWSSISWKTKRMGDIAYRVDGGIATGLYPIFVKIEENPERAKRALRRQLEWEESTPG